MTGRHRCSTCDRGSKIIVTCDMNIFFKFNTGHGNNVATKTCDIADFKNRQATWGPLLKGPYPILFIKLTILNRKIMGTSALCRSPLS